ncbi:MAG: hypothetical protein ACOCP8_10180 [archaeon]
MLFIVEVIISFILTGIILTGINLSFFTNIPLTLFFNKINEINITISYVIIVLLVPLLISFSLIYIFFFHLYINLTTPIFAGIILGFIVFFPGIFKNKKYKVKNFVENHNVIFKDQIFVSVLLTEVFDKKIEKFKGVIDKPVEAAIVDLHYDIIEHSIDSFIEKNFEDEYFE